MEISENIWRVYFSSKAMERVNLPFILHNTQLVPILKDLTYNFATPTAV